jgi:Rrf2 family protein
MTYVEASIGLDYALRAVLALSATYPQRITGADLARNHDLPRKFLENLLSSLRRAGLIQTRQGPQGGYGLAYRQHRSPWPK